MSGNMGLFFVQPKIELQLLDWTPSKHFSLYLPDFVQVTTNALTASPIRIVVIGCGPRSHRVIANSLHC